MHSLTTRPVWVACVIDSIDRHMHVVDELILIGASKVANCGACSARFAVTIGLTVVCGGFSAGCQTIQPSEGLLEQNASTARISSRELRALMDDYVKRFADEVEEAADQILAEERDPQIRANALLWKTNGISACFQAAARPDALSAFLDVWILNKQSIALFERPTASHLFGGWQKLALETCQRLEVPLAEIQSKIGSDFPIGEDFVTSFANDYPITSLYFRRESVAARYTDYMERIDVSNRELMDVVGGLDERLDQLHKLAAAVRRVSAQAGKMAR